MEEKLSYPQEVNLFAVLQEGPHFGPHLLPHSSQVPEHAQLLEGPVDLQTRDPVRREPHVTSHTPPSRHSGTGTLFNLYLNQESPIESTGQERQQKLHLQHTYSNSKYEKQFSYYSYYLFLMALFMLCCVLPTSYPASTVANQWRRATSGSEKYHLCWRTF